MRRHQLIAVYLLLGIDYGKGFVGREIGHDRRKRGSYISSSPITLTASRKKQNSDDGEDDKASERTQRRRFTSLFTDLLSRKREVEPADKPKGKKPSRSKTRKQDRSKASSEPNQSKSWLRRIFRDNDNDRDSSADKTPKVKPSKDPSPKPAASSPQSISKLGQSLATMGYSSSSARKAKQKKIEEQNQAPPAFNPFLYIQTAWKNTASSFFDGESKAQKDEWITVFQTSGIMPGESVPITVKGIDLLVVASLDGRAIYCIENSCPHLGTPLETGQLTRLPMEESSIKARPSSDDTDTTTTTDIFGAPQDRIGLILSETQVSEILSQDGCEDCIVCPLHRTAFALRSGAVRGDWCPHPPMLGPALGTIKPPTAAKTYEIRTRGKNVQVKLLPENPFTISSS